MAKLAGKVALVTGASGGVGSAIAKTFAAEGAHVVVHYHRNQKSAEAVAKAVRAQRRRALVVQADVAQVGEVEELVARTVQELGRLDILVNNAGYADRAVWHAQLDDVTEEMWRQVMDTDVKGTFLCSRAVARPMLRQKGGCIINVSSTPALTGDTSGFLYSVGKAAILGMTKSLAWMLAPHVRVNAMAFGSIRTGWVDWLNAADVKALQAETALKRFGEPEEVGRVAVFLASEESSYMTGQTLVVDGGAYMH